MTKVNEQDPPTPAASRLLVRLIRSYQRWLSPLLGNQCRFSPTCSEYSAQALQTHGTFRGLRLTFWRLLRCQPFAKGGFDEVPPRCQPSAPSTHECPHHATH